VSFRKYPAQIPEFDAALALCDHLPIGAVRGNRLRLIKKYSALIPGTVVRWKATSSRTACEAVAMLESRCLHNKPWEDYA
jgi:hypothetical protein